MASTTGRRVVVPLTNKSGGSVIAGDVVILDSANDDAFTTTTSGGATSTIGIAQESIASNAAGPVLLQGEAALVNVNASVTRGQYGKTHTVAKQATGTAARGVGTFCQWKTGGTTPKAVIFNADLLGSSLTDPTTTRGDIITRGAAALQRLALGAAGTVPKSDGTDVVFGTPGEFATAVARVETNESTASTTFANLATPGPSVTVVIGASGKAKVTISARHDNNNASGVDFVAVDVSGASTVAASLATGFGSPGALAGNRDGSTHVYTGLTPGSTTFKMQYGVTVGTGSFQAREIIVEPVI